MPGGDGRCVWNVWKDKMGVRNVWEDGMGQRSTGWGAGRLTGLPESFGSPLDTAQKFPLKSGS